MTLFEKAERKIASLKAEMREIPYIFPISWERLAEHIGITARGSSILADVFVVFGGCACVSPSGSIYGTIGSE